MIRQKSASLLSLQCQVSNFRHWPHQNDPHCYKYRLIKSGSGGFLAATMLEQDLNSEIKHLQEQELKENECTKKNAGTSIEKYSILVPA